MDKSLDDIYNAMKIHSECLVEEAYDLGYRKAKEEIMDNETTVTITAKELREFYASLDNEKRDLFFTLLAAGKTGEFARNYIICTIMEGRT